MLALTLATGQCSDGISVAGIDAMNYAQPKGTQFKPQLIERVRFTGMPRDEPTINAFLQSTPAPVQQSSCFQ